MSDILTRIAAGKREEVARAKARRSFAEIERAARSASPPRDFLAALERAASAGGYGLIAEIKRASPSRGLIRADFDPARLAVAYEEGGAACLSVLTDEPHFEGRPEHLAAARRAARLPVLRKDFMLDPYQIFESRAMGADCVLLIMALLDDELVAALEATAEELGMAALVEVHDRGELARAVRLRSPLLGVNNRNLKTFEVDLRTTEELATGLPEGKRLVSESGIHTPQDLARLARVGARCFLVGESLMRQDDVAAATRALLAR